MASQGPLSAGGSTQLTFTSLSWTNPGNITASDDAYATFALVDTSKYLVSTSHGFSIPTTATINGIVAEIEKSYVDGGGGSLATTDGAVRLVKAGAIVGNSNHSLVDWPTTDTYSTYGNATDLWGTTWTPAQINASNFGVGIAAVNDTGNTSQVDHIRITVYYTDVNIPLSRSIYVQLLPQ